MKLKKLSILFGLLLIALLVYFSNYHQVIGHISAIKLHYLAAAFFIIALSAFFRAERWRVLICRKVGFLELTKAQTLGILLNKIFPLRAGTLFKTLYLKKMAKVPFGHSFGTVFAENIIEIIFIMASCFVVAMLLPIRSLELERAILITLFVFFACVVLFVLFLEYFPMKWLMKKMLKFDFMKRRIPNKKTTIRKDFKKYLFSLPPKKLFLGGVFTLFIWFLTAIAHLVLIKGLNADVPLIYIYLISTFPFLVGVLSLIPGGLGLHEFTFVGILSLIGLPLPLATTIAILFRIVDYCVYAVFGLWGYFTLASDTTKIYKQADISKDEND